MAKTMTVTVDKEKCTACGTCVDSCPVEAIKLEEKAIVDAENCIDCGTCVDECPEEAISLE
jgi:ferredoxin